MTNKRFDQTGDIKAFKVLTPGYDALFRLIVDDASARTVREIDDVLIGKSRSGSPRYFYSAKPPNHSHLTNSPTAGDRLPFDVRCNTQV
jgi:hypothetical protein